MPRVHGELDVGDHPSAIGLSAVRYCFALLALVFISEQDADLSWTPFRLTVCCFLLVCPLWRVGAGKSPRLACPNQSVTICAD